MHFVLDENNKIAFGWTPKSGCSHVKFLFYFLTESKNKVLHTERDYQDVNKITDEYKIFIFIRNPYERIVSGFIDKYKTNGQFFNMWPSEKKLSFANFINELKTSKYRYIDELHFEPHINDNWKEPVKNNKNIVVMDITNIDYSIFETLYNRRIPESIIKYRGEHENYKETKDFESKKIYDLTQEEYIDFRPCTKNFYNDEVINIVKEFYKVDFEYFTLHNFHYKSPVI